MGRSILAAIAGYLTMALTIMLTFTLAYITMGADGAFKPATYQPSTLWLTASFTLGALAAVLGGFICAAIARDKRGVIILIALVIGIGTLAAIGGLFKDRPDPGVRTGEVSNMEAMTKAVQPTWVNFLNPIIGVAGVIIGSRLKRPSPTA